MGTFATKKDIKNVKKAETLVNDLSALESVIQWWNNEGISDPVKWFGGNTKIMMFDALSDGWTPPKVVND